ncbi:unnamed protein product [Meganyctiphanes norvegica]|uniref:Uncharacterized protein n=1 Tax=Meganyctiphanes norvegica TaxID=48144 RepID=A0AAV2PWZ7_MEGNR
MHLLDSCSMDSLELAKLDEKVLAGYIIRIKNKSFTDFFIGHIESIEEKYTAGWHNTSQLSDTVVGGRTSLSLSHDDSTVFINIAFVNINMALFGYSRHENGNMIELSENVTGTGQHHLMSSKLHHGPWVSH